MGAGVLLPPPVDPSLWTSWFERGCVPTCTRRPVCWSRSTRGAHATYWQSRTSRFRYTSTKYCPGRNPSIHQPCQILAITTYTHNPQQFLHHNPQHIHRFLHTHCHPWSPLKGPEAPTKTCLWISPRPPPLLPHP